MTRYHSLVVEPDALPACFDVTAWSETREIMGIRHRQWDLEGVQFHPESILSEQGHQLLAKFPALLISDCHSVIFYAYFVIIISHLFMRNRGRS